MGGGYGSLGWRLWEPSSGWCVPDFGYVDGEDALVTVVGVRGYNNNVGGLKLCRGWEA